MRMWGSITAVLTTLALASHAGAQAVAHHAATAFVDPAQGVVRVMDRLSFESAEAGETVLRLSAEFDLDSAVLNDRPVDLKRTPNGLIVPLDRSGAHTLALTYQSDDHAYLTKDGGFLDGDWLAHPADRLATWRIEARSTKGQKLVMPGSLLSEQSDSDGYSATFASSAPAQQPPVLITGPFTVGQKIAGGVRVRTYFHPELAPLSQTYLDDAARYIAYYTDTVGPYPYPGFAIVSGPAPVGWGLPGMTYMGQRVLALSFIRFTSLPHEVLHNWWGNAVEVDYANGNWAEGLTTYQADHAMAEAAHRRDPAHEGGKDKRLEWLRNYAALPHERDHALTDFRSKSHDASQVVGYGKTALVFHMLKNQLGEATFNAALQRFNRDNTGKIAGWADIQTAFEAESRQNLDAFFDAWIKRPGAPELALSDAKADANAVSFTLRQVQDGPVYPLNLTVAVKTPQGFEQHAITLNTARESYTLKTQTRPSAVRIDPHFDVFRRLDRNETPPIVRDVTLNPNTQLVALGDGPMRDQGHALAGRLLQARLRLLDDPLKADTLIITGPQEVVRPYLASRGLPDAPKDIAAQGDARAWTVRRKSGQTVLVVESQTPDAFAALARVLPHYKKRSFVVVKDGKTAHKGTWDAGPGPLQVQF